MARRLLSALACFGWMGLLAAGLGAAQPAPTPLSGLAYDASFFPGTDYDPEIPTIESLLGMRAGDRAAFPAQVETCLAAWAAASPRANLVEYARSHEGRPLAYMIVSSPENMARLEEIQAGLDRLADPRGVDRAEADRLVATLPATAWLAYSIHGDETSGTDAALAVLYHLIAGTSADVTDLLRDLVVLVDPMMNPDGRHRFLQQIAEHRATTPNVDDQSLLHAGYWPWGRGNHYLFDLNRDWLTAVQPETRGRIRAAASWHPLLFVDAHEMGALETYLFAPARAPRNPHVPARRKIWNDRFARDQSEAFDRNHWLYYTGEWNEGWYPGYSDSWAEYRGAIGILYEQAGFAEDAVRQASGVLTTYREAVHHQAVSSLSNLRSLAANSRPLLAEFAEERRRAVAADGPYAGRTFAVLPTDNAVRRERLLELLHLQGIEVWVAPREIAGLSGIDQLGRSFSRRAVPAGTLLIPNRQPEAHWVATSLEFDTRMTDEYLERERAAILKEGSSSLYDLTAWNVTMLFGLEALTLDGDLPAAATRLLDGTESAPGGEAAASEGMAVAWVIDGADDRSVAAAARLVESGVEVRVASRAFELAGAGFRRGSVVVLPADNPRFEGDLEVAVGGIAADLGLEAAPVNSGLGDGELPDLGGGHFTRIEPPRVVLVGRRGVSTTDFGALWYTLDRDLGIRHSEIEADTLASADLRRYNVVLLPETWVLEDKALAALATWVEAGGTLIASGRSAAALAVPESPLSAARELSVALESLDEYELAVLRESAAREKSRPADALVWSHTAARQLEYPWSALASSARPGLEELRKRDAWQRMFMPQGAILAARTDPEHWLTLGVAAELPVLFGASSVLMAGSTVEAPVRFGVLADAPGADGGRVGWGPVPPGKDLLLRMSGLLWPEAGQRLANSAYVTREKKGAGQVILFAAPPTFRASTLGTARLLLNAVVYGPGFGASAPIQP